MKKELLARKVLCSVLAIGLGGLVLPLAAQANSGLRDEPLKIVEGDDGSKYYYYIGSKGAADNVVVIDRDLTADDAGVIGGYAEKGDAINNSVHISGGTVYTAYDDVTGGGVDGGYAEKGDAISNNISMSGGMVYGGVYGGHAEKGDAINNSVYISGGTAYTVDADYGGVDGGYAEKGDAISNNVSMSGGMVYGAVYGGHAEKGDAINNSVHISGGTVCTGYDGVSGGGVHGGYAEKGDAISNSVSMSGGNVLAVIGGHAEGNNSTAAYNRVNITGGTIKGILMDINGMPITVGANIYGGSANGENSKVTGNSVTISGTVLVVNSVLHPIAGGYGVGENSQVTDNNVTISGGTVSGYVCGGYAIGENSQVTGNSVTIRGGAVSGNVYGGWARDENSQVTGNSVTLSGTADVSKAALYGGCVNSDMGGIVSDNKLIINGWSGKVQSLNDFNGDKGGIEVKALAGGLDLAVGQRTDFITATGTEVEVGDEKKVNYIENSFIKESSKQVENIQAGVALTVSGDIGMDDKNIYINPTSVRASDQTAITTESRAAAAAFVNQGAVVVSDSINGLQGADAGVSTFAAVSGNNSKYDTGSYVDINGWNGIVGVANNKEINAGKLSYGAFFENGSGNYNTYNDFNGTSFRGDGNVVYNGGGLLMRYEDVGGVYTEASLRAGTAKNEVSNALEFAGNRYGYKTENAYYGAHIGIGKIFKLDNGKAWDVYGKYFHTHHEGDSVKIAGDVFDFDSVDSDKLRIGARFSEQQSEKLASYYGLAWEYEFSGDAGGTANHHAMYTPSLEGSTVIGEIGFRYTPGKESPWYFDANVRGYVGMQEGISGSVQAVYSF